MSSNISNPVYRKTIEEPGKWAWGLVVFLYRQFFAGKDTTRGGAARRSRSLCPSCRKCYETHFRKPGSDYCCPPCTKD